VTSIGRVAGDLPRSCGCGEGHQGTGGARTEIGGFQLDGRHNRGLTLLSGF